MELEKCRTGFTFDFESNVGEVVSSQPMRISVLIVVETWMLSFKLGFS